MQEPFSAPRRRYKGMAVKPHRPRNWNILVDKRSQNVLCAPLHYGDVEICDLWRTRYIADGMNERMTGLNLDRVNVQVAVGAVDRALNGSQHQRGLSALHGKVGRGGTGIRFDGSQHPFEVTCGIEIPANVAHVMQIDRGEREVARHRSRAQILRIHWPDSTVGSDAARRI